MNPQQAVQQMIQMVDLAENELFTGSFSESTVKSDLAIKPEKRSYYIKQYNEWEDSMNTVIDLLGSNPTARDLISRAKKTKEQAKKMLAYVRSH